jgi:predicted phage gp36 major capsid-like protein
MSTPVGGWTVTKELLAQVIEEVSILAAEKRRKEPVSVHRPPALEDAAAVPQGNSPRQPRMTGHRKMLAAAARRGMVQVSG